MVHVFGIEAKKYPTLRIFFNSDEERKKKKQINKKKKIRGAKC